MAGLLRRLASRALAAPGRGPRLVMVCACALVLGMYATNHDMGGDPTTPRGDGVYRPVLARGDGHLLYLMARSTALDLDWRFDNDLARFGDPWREPRTATGRKAIVHPIGPALVWTPLIWAAEAGAVVANVFGAGIPLHGYTLWCQRFVFLSSVVFGCGAVLLGRRLAKQTLGGAWAATYAAVAVLLGTSLTYYATYMPSYSHAMVAFACAAFLAYWAATLGRCDARRWAALGALLGVAALVRTQELAFGVVVMVEVAWRLAERGDVPRRRRAARWIGGGGLALAVALVVLIPQALEWQLVFGSFTHLPQGPRFTRYGAPMIAELLFSPRNGWLATTPIAYLACLGLACAPRRARLVAAGFGAAILLQIYLNSTILDWWASASFGQRRMCNVTLPLVVGLAFALWRAGQLAARWRRAPRWVWHVVLVVGLAPFVGWNLWRVGQLRAGKAAPSGLVPSCCGDFAPALRPAARWIYERIGDPFELPASAVFAWTHGVELSRWDRTVGRYPLMPALADLHDDARFYATRGRWDVGAPSLAPYLVGGWSGSLAAPGGRARLTTSAAATVLVPNRVPERQRVTVWLAPAGAREVVLAWNGREVAREALHDGWNPVAFDLPRAAIHTNELTIRAQPGVWQPPAGWPPAPRTAGVAVRSIDLALEPP